MRVLVVPLLLIAFIKSTTPRSSHDYYEEEYLSPAEGGASAEDPIPEGRILGSLLKGWKGDDDHPLTEFGKIHIIKKGGGWGGRGGLHHGHHDGHGQGWGWGGQYGPGWTTTYHTTGWTKPHHKKKSWFPKKSFGIHVKGGVGFSFGGKKGAKKGQTVVVQHTPNHGWGWNSGYGHGNQGWGWGHGGHHGGHDEFYGGDYYDDDAKKEDVADDDIPGDDGNDDDPGHPAADEDDRRRMDLGDYLYDY